MYLSSDWQSDDEQPTYSALAHIIYRPIATVKHSLRLVNVQRLNLYYLQISPTYATMADITDCWSRRIQCSFNNQTGGGGAKPQRPQTKNLAAQRSRALASPPQKKNCLYAGPYKNGRILSHLKLLGWRQSYYLKSHKLTLTEAANVAENQPLWRLLAISLRTPVAQATDKTSGSIRICDAKDCATVARRGSELTINMETIGRNVALFWMLVHQRFATGLCSDSEWICNAQI